MTLEFLKQAFKELSEGEKSAMATWILQQESEIWDRQIEEDFSPGGRGANLVAQAEADVAAGRVQPLEQFLNERRRTGS